MSDDKKDSKGAAESSKERKVDGFSVYTIIEYLSLIFIGYLVFRFFYNHYDLYHNSQQHMDGRVQPIYGPNLTRDLLDGIYNRDGNVTEQIEERTKFIYPMMISNQSFTFKVFLSF
jgi:hypothetical protein